MPATQPAEMFAVRSRSGGKQTFGEARTHHALVHGDKVAPNRVCCIALGTHLTVSPSHRSTVETGHEQNARPAWP
jgi:hypothetical protein